MEISLNNRQTFGHGKPLQPLATIERHIYNQESKTGECGELPDNNRYPLFRYLSVATRIENAPVCPKCLEAVGA